MAVLRGLEPGLAAIDLGSALLVLALMLTATVMAFSRLKDPGLPDRLSFRSPYARWAFWTWVTVFVVLVSGVLVATSGSMVRCLGWPLYGGLLNPVDVRGWLLLARRLFAVSASILVIAVVVQAWREKHRQGAIRITAAAVGVLLVIEMVVGALMLVYGPTLPLHVLYTATAAAFWASLVALVVLASLLPPTPAVEDRTAESARISL
jgi:heme A synthase